MPHSCTPVGKSVKAHDMTERGHRHTCSGKALAQSMDECGIAMGPSLDHCCCSNLPAYPLAASIISSLCCVATRSWRVCHYLQFPHVLVSCPALPPTPLSLAPTLSPSLQHAHPYTAQSPSSMCTAGERPQRAKHLWRWMYHKDHWVRDLEETHGKQCGFGADFRCSMIA